MFKILPITAVGFAAALMMNSTTFAKSPKPPAEAFTACAGSSAGASCQVATKHDDLPGSCRVPPQQDQLVCVPDNHKRGSDKSSKPKNTTETN